MVSLPPLDADVPGRDALADAVRELCEDFRQRGDEWENPTLDRFLDALSAWISSADQWYANNGERVPEFGDWTFFARALRAAAVYE